MFKTEHGKRRMTSHRRNKLYNVNGSFDKTSDFSVKFVFNKNKSQG